MLASEAAHHELSEGPRTSHRLIQQSDDPGHVFYEVGRRWGHVVVLGTHPVRQHTGVGGLVISRPLVVPAVEHLYTGPQVVRRQRTHHARIETTRQISAERDVGTQLQPDAVVDQRAHPLNGVVVGA